MKVMEIKVKDEIREEFRKFILRLLEEFQHKTFDALPTEVYFPYLYPIQLTKIWLESE
jgi:hypothetical protein